jgi:hypothetical protein
VPLRRPAAIRGATLPVVRVVPPLPGEPELLGRAAQVLSASNECSVPNCSLVSSTTYLRQPLVLIPTRPERVLSGGRTPQPRSWAFRACGGSSNGEALIKEIASVGGRKRPRDRAAFSLLDQCVSPGLAFCNDG